VSWHVGGCFDRRHIRGRSLGKVFGGRLIRQRRGLGCLVRGKRIGWGFRRGRYLTLGGRGRRFVYGRRLGAGHDDRAALEARRRFWLDWLGRDRFARRLRRQGWLGGLRRSGRRRSQPFGRNFRRGGGRIGLADQDFVAGVDHRRALHAVEFKQFVERQPVERGDCPGRFAFPN